ncbi:MAG: hypothetical protein COW01_13810 [Bdellovibrionales bacterium CG12_big_fil_rev_8_21_14_0_65_38_15]|nr:MAG: hypothetical protein COW79_16630 [Bdellovibrionales bacterium CG22_combo_CG10-13_8_21_14_all_38_13]PIQ53348.1 MAG: hypothetical protein COW01_13810 [Bdellovibrionales bacterium CG12_big_fil_rev_8_21_14_0_65_38_15]PIR30288.1 MAG: hypothetical protein COV38_05945 [Bdellovibrionales bacterium CG11_big_fil_rev_8_21_14_0_20_38_13]
MTPIFFLCIPTNTDLLKAELASFKDKIKISFNVPGFITCLCDESVLDDILKNPPLLSLAMGRDAKRIQDQAPTIWIEHDVLKVSGNPHFIFKDKKDNLWQADCFHFEKLIELIQLQLPEEAPSRAWLKIAQAFKALNLDRSNYKHAIEIGSSPGGASYFLTGQNYQLTGIDPGEMSSTLLANTNFKHIKKPVQDIIKSELPKDIDLLAVDTNLSATQSVKESLRIAAFYPKSLKEIFLTIKLPIPKLIPQLENHKRAMRKLGFKVQYLQLPSHHREVLLYGKRVNNE